MDLKATRDKVGKRVCLVGNIDCAHLLPADTTSEVRDAVRRAIADAGKQKAFILSSSNSIHSGCRPENVLAMVQACHEFGTYCDMCIGLKGL